MTELAPKWRPPAPEPPPRKLPFGWIVGAAALVIGAALGVQLMRSTASRRAPATARAESLRAPSVVAAPPSSPSAIAAPAPSALPAIVSPTAPSASASAASRAPIDLDFDEAGARATMIRAAALHEWATSQNAFDALADKVPAAFADRQVALAARDLAVGLEKEGAGEKVFDRLARGLGTAGLDILYTIVESRGGSKAAARAADLLRETEVLKRATPELRIAFELREAPCDKKGDLLERAGKEGDARTLVVLKTMTSSCFKKSKPLALAIYEVTERVKRSEAVEAKENGVVPPPVKPRVTVRAKKR